MLSNICSLVWERELYGRNSKLNIINSSKTLEQRIQLEMEQNLELSKLKSINTATTNSTISSMSIDTSDQKYLITGGLDKSISIYDIDVTINLEQCKVEPHAISPMVTIPKEATHDFMISCVQWYPHDTGMFFTGSYDQMLKVWDTNELQVVTKFRFPDKLLHFHASPSASKHQLIAGASKHSTIRLCDLTSGAFTHSLTGHRDSVYDVKFSPTDEHILYSASSDHTIRVWDLRKSGYLFCFNQFNTFYNRKEDATNSKFSTKKLHPNTPVVTAHNGAVNALQITPNGQYLLSTGNDNAMRLWNTKTGMNTLINYPNIVNPHRKTIEFDVSPDGKVVYFPNEGNICLYETYSGKLIQKLVGHYNMVNSVRYYSKENELYSASNDNKIFVWSPKRCHIGIEETLSFGRDGEKEDTSALLQDNWSDDEA